MKVKKFISVCLSTGVLFSSALSGGSSLFATEPGKDISKLGSSDEPEKETLEIYVDPRDLWDFIEYTQEFNLINIKKRVDDICYNLSLSRENFFLEPITPEFFQRMVCILEKIWMEDAPPETINDVGYVGNVLLRHSSHAKDLFFSKLLSETDECFKAKCFKGRNHYISFYDSLFYIYWMVFRAVNIAIPKNKQGFDPGSWENWYWEFIKDNSRCSPDRALGFHFAIVKSCVSTIDKYKKFGGSIERLENIVKNIIGLLESNRRKSKLVLRKERYISSDVNEFIQTSSKGFSRLISKLRMKRGFYEEVPTLGNTKFLFGTSLDAMAQGKKELGRNFEQDLSNAMKSEENMIEAERLLVEKSSVIKPKLAKVEPASVIAKRKQTEYDRAKQQKENEKEAERKKAEKKQDEYEAKQTEWQEKEKQREKVKTERKEKEAAEKAAKKAAEPQKTEEQLQQEREAAESERLKYMCAASNAEQGLVEDESGAIKTGKKVRNRKKEECLIESTSSEELTSSSMSSSDRSDSPVTEFKNLNEDLQVLFETESKGSKELKIDGVDGEYTLVYEPSLFSNLKSKGCNDAAKNDIMQLMRNLYIGGTDKARLNLGKKRVINMSSAGQSKNDLYKTYSEKLYAIFGGKENLSLYKFRLNGSKEFRIAYFVNKDQKRIYVTNNIEHIEK